MTSPFGDDSRPKINEFQDRIAKVLGHRPRFSHAVNGYSVIEALTRASERAGTTDGDKVLAELNKFNNEPLTIGPTTFTPELHIQMTRPLAVLEIRNGKGYFADLVELSEAPPLQLVFKKK